MPEQSNTPTIIRWVAILAVVVVALVVIKAVFALALSVLFYVGVALIAGAIGTHFVKKKLDA